MNDHDLHALMFSCFTIGAVVILLIIYSLLEQTKIVKSTVLADLKAYNKKNRRLWWLAVFYPAFFAIFGALWCTFRLVLPEKTEISMYVLQAELGVGAILLTLNQLLESKNKSNKRS